MSSPPVHPHFKQQARSYANLEAARKIGTKKTGYNSATTRERVKNHFFPAFWTQRARMANRRYRGNSTWLK